MFACILLTGIPEFCRIPVSGAGEAEESVAFVAAAEESAATAPAKHFLIGYRGVPARPRTDPRTPHRPVREVSDGCSRIFKQTKADLSRTNNILYNIFKLSSKRIALNVIVKFVQ